MDSSDYKHRKVSIGEEWFIEVEGLNVTNQKDLDKALISFETIHGWPTNRQVIVHADGTRHGAKNSQALDLHKFYVEEVRVGPHRKDVSVTPWTKAILNREQILKGSLQTALQQKALDYSKIINLSSELASLDEVNVRFSVDAGIINRLGKELVGRAETALSELVKNGYDSDATQVTLTFAGNSKVGGTLTVVDNGNGMTQEDLINGFMRLSSTDKIHNPKSPVFKRTRAGRKGIGRFATQRLGLKLTIITQTSIATEAIKVTIDWSRFVTDSNLLTIESKIETVKARPEGKGTMLLIEGLREAWSEPSIKRAYRYLSELLQPFPLSSNLSSGKNDPGFKVDVYQQEPTGEPRVVINEERAFYDHAIAVIEGYVDEKGVGFWAVDSKRLGVTQDVQPLGKSDGIQSKPYDHLRNIHLKAYYFIFESGLFPPSTMTTVRETLREQGGIRIYRNGFRVLPYGEQDDDWTGLDAHVRRNVIIAPHGNNNFLGFVELVDSEGQQFDETASREKLVENSAFEELSDFTQRAILGGVLRIAAERGRKGHAGEKRKTSQKPTETIKDAAQDALKKIEGMKQENIVGTPKTEELIVSTFPEEGGTSLEVNSSPSSIQLIQFEDVFKTILGATAKQEEQTTKLIEEINQLRVLAGLGLVIGQFVHEIKTYVTSFNLDIQQLNKLLGGNGKALQVLATIEHNVQAFSTYRSYFERVISDNVSRELQPLELREVVRPFIKTITADAEKSGITIIPTIFEGYNLFTVPMHRSEWASILFNFYSNAKKAIHHTGGVGKIFIKCGKEDGVVYLEFSDSGVGIPVENEERVFDAFFTTSQPPSRQANFREELTGMGLGLKIVRDIVESYQGSIFVALPEPSFSTTLRIQIPTNRTE